MLMYRTNKWYTNIVEVEVTRFNDKSIWKIVNGKERREGRNSEIYNYHTTWKEAHDFLLKCAEEKLNNARLALQKAQGEYGNIKGMKEPS